MRSQTNTEYKDFYAPFLTEEEYSKFQKFSDNLDLIERYRVINDINKLQILSKANELIQEELKPLFAKSVSLQNKLAATAFVRNEQSIRGNVFHQLAIHGWTGSIMPVSFSEEKSTAKFYKQSEYERHLTRLLEMGLDPNEKDSYFEQTSLLAAIAIDNIGYSLALLKFKKYVKLDEPCSETWYATTPLIMAIQRGQREVIEKLVEVGANVNKPDIFGLTPLHWAIIMADISTTKLLLSRQDIQMIKTIDGKYPLDYLSIAQEDLEPAKNNSGSDMPNSTKQPEFRPIVAHFWSGTSTFLELREKKSADLFLCLKVLIKHNKTNEVKEKQHLSTNTSTSTDNKSSTTVSDSTASVFHSNKTQDHDTIEEKSLGLNSKNSSKR